ncbi:MAG: lamin tail domain-containing protein [Candidatus Methanomethylophilaceae archaeon]|nr:lamin tail domain-containing protein [Candidatus Methanomethylophilaceae archaeon]
MDALRKTLVCITVLAMFCCAVPLGAADQGSDAIGDANGVLLYEVNPRMDDVEGFSLYNYSSKTIDLNGYYVSDSPGKGEGKVTFTSKLNLGAGERITVAKSIDTDNSFTSRDNTFKIGTNGIESSGSFSLAKDGDDLYLFNPSGTIIDAFCYGSKTISDSTIWTGESVTLYGSFIMQRDGTFDSDSSDDWFSFIPGQSDFDFDPTIKYDATVTPFLFPESGGIPIYRALEAATESVYIQMYEIRSPNIYGLLCELEDRGVEVTLLLEGGSVGRGLAEDAPKIRALVDHGGTVRVIGGTDVDRYENMHAKYAVIDGDTVIVTSENWSTANCNGKIDDKPYVGTGTGNRGWGAVIESKGYADFMMDVFWNDYSMDYDDTREFLSLYPNSVAANVYYEAPASDYTFQSYSAKVTPVLSNDSSYDAMKYYIANADERVYAENQSLTSYYAELGEGTPIYMMNERAKDGVDAKFILSGGFDPSSSQNEENAVYLINSTTSVSATIMDKPYVHNKGLICDDSVWVSSINWTPTSVNNNREVCAVIHSAAVADFFAESFNQDFQMNYDYDGFSVDISEIQSSYPSGKEVTFTVTVSPEGDYTYKWDLGDGSGVRTTSVPRIAATPADGSHKLTVTVTDNDTGISNKVEKTYYVGSDPGTSGDGTGGNGTTGDDTLDIQLPESLGFLEEYIVPIIVIIIAILGALIRAIKK